MAGAEEESLTSEAEAALTELAESLVAGAEEESLTSEAEAALTELTESLAAGAEEESLTSEAEAALSEAADAFAEALLIGTYADFAEAEMDTPVIVNAYVQAKQALNPDGTTSLYIADENGSYFVYNVPCTEEDYEKLTEGQAITVKGYKSSWSGEDEILDAEIEILEGEEPYIAEAVALTDLLESDELDDYMNSKVLFESLTVAGTPDPENEDELVPFLYNWDGSGTQGNDLYFTVADDEGNTYTFTVESDLCDKDSDVYKAVENLQVGDVIDAEGFLYWYEGPQPHITSVEVIETAEEAKAAEAEDAESEAAQSEAVESGAAQSELTDSETEDPAAKVVAALSNKE